MRTHADTLTIAYIAIGAIEAIRKANTPFHGDDWNGELGFIDRCTSCAHALDTRGEEVQWERDDGVFCYEVAQVFGERYGTELLKARVHVNPEKLIRELLPDPPLTGPLIMRLLNGLAAPSGVRVDAPGGSPVEGALGYDGPVLEGVRLIDWTYHRMQLVFVNDEWRDKAQKQTGWMFGDVACSLEPWHLGESFQIVTEKGTEWFGDALLVEAPQ